MLRFLPRGCDKYFKSFFPALLQKSKCGLHCWLMLPAATAGLDGAGGPVWLPRFLPIFLSISGGHRDVPESFFLSAFCLWARSHSRRAINKEYILLYRYQCAHISAYK